MERGMHNADSWVDHTYQVRLELQRFRANCLKAESDRSAYLLTGSQDSFAALQTDIHNMWDSFGNLRHLTSDNIGQQERLNEIDDLATSVVTQIQAETADAGGRPTGSTTQLQSTTQLMTSDAKIRDLAIAMRQEEDRLLGIRQDTQQKRLREIFDLLLILVIVGLVLTAFYLRSSWAEVAAAHLAQKASQDAATAYRTLSAKILELQDKERRRVARELHDSVGQYLAVLRMNLDRLQEGDPRLIHDSNLLAETLEITDNAIAEVRTISHLLHPPMLEEIGLGDAIIWYIEQFSKRSGMKVALNVPDKFERLPRAIELGLFRALQESLTNTHRHSGAQNIEVTLSRLNRNVILVVTDNGKGIPKATLARFQQGIGGGVGLAGMRERISELGGELQVQSNSKGTSIRAILPVEFVDPVMTDTPDSYI
jgi:signal transduction histidine kinase